MGRRTTHLVVLEAGRAGRDAWRTGVQYLMPKRMLIDATHAEETRVVVLDGNRLEDFDIETSAKRQLKGNIYLAKVVRVEPSLQAAFVEYGGNRHGFLAFSEIHPDYYQIPVADRQRLLELQAEQARLEEEEDDLELALNQTEEPASPLLRDEATPAPTAELWAFADQPRLLTDQTVATPIADEADGEAPPDPLVAELPLAGLPSGEPASAEPTVEEPVAEPWARPEAPALFEVAVTPALFEAAATVGATDADFEDEDQPDTGDDLDMFGSIPEEAPPETIGGEVDADNDNDGGEDRPERRIPPRFLRNYHIQEVIHRRQILLVQVVKEERGTKGAALTTYLSLAGRFSVLMPNSPRGGGISRKITSATDRRRLKEIMIELDIPKGMGLIVRTAGAQRPKPEIKRDCEYLLRMWDDIREHTLKSIAPALIYEEASLIKRAIRDVYSRDIDDITVDGEDAWRAAHEFMRMLMPSHARKVHMWPDQGQSLFARFQVEAQLDAMMQPTVQLRSGGYLVINQAEALVAIDVNSGRSTRERNVEETALRTNLEAADEVARQLRLRDLAGLIVIDFIDMESKRHNAMVERRLKEALKDDRARIQVGHISHFGLLEMSRQRLRPSLEETTLIICPQCNGTGHVRGTESAALHVLRGVEEEAGKRRSAEVIVHVATAIALYILNHKRERLNEIERRYGMRVIIAADDTLMAPRFRIDRVRAIAPGEEPRFVTPDVSRGDVPRGDVPRGDVARGAAPVVTALPATAEIEAEAEDDDDTDVDGEDADDAAVAGAEDTEEAREAERRRRRRRRRRGRGREDEVQPNGQARGDVAPEPAEPVEPLEREPEPALALSAEDDGQRDDSQRRPRRGRRRRGGDGDLPPHGFPGAEQPDLTPVYAGPTPADPFGGNVFDLFDAMEQAELNAVPAQRAPRDRRPPRDRQRWHPPHWADPGQPPMLETESAAVGRPERVSSVEYWALPSRPFMLRRDRHAPRWGQRRGAPVPETRAPVAEPVVEAPAANARPVPIEAGPPPVLELVASVVPEQPVTATASPEPVASPEPEPVASIPSEPVTAAELPDPVALPEPEPVASAMPEPAVPAPVEAQASPVESQHPMAGAPVPELVGAEAVHEPAPVPANDVVSGPMVQPIVIGSESAPPVERKRGWWRRR
jgi:ribonuclease E